MDNGYLTTQVATIIKSLHETFDEIGVPSHDREAREAALYKALSETLETQLRLVAAEKNALIEEANKYVATIRQMRRSMEDDKRANENDNESDGLRITYPLRECVNQLKDKYDSINRQYQERFEQVKKLVKALESYACQLETGFIRVALPNLNNPSPTFKISNSYMQILDAEFSRVYEEYTRRIATVKHLCGEIVHLWAEMDTPAVQTDRQIVECCRNASDKVDVKAEDIQRLRVKKQRLLDEKTMRERKLADLKRQVEELWEKFDMDEEETKAFTAKFRGCTLSALQGWEGELARLFEIKKKHIHVFVEDARHTLQELWDNLYYSEEEMLEFKPAFSEVYTDALLEAHELEIARLQKVMDDRAPVLAMVEKYQTLMNDKLGLEASSQDSSRLLGKGPRDPTRLLREEKMRKRIAKELPKVEADLIVALEDWEVERGEAFYVNGTSYLETLLENQRPSSKTSQNSASSVLKATGSRAPQKAAQTPKAAPARPNSAAGHRSVAAKTPTTVRNAGTLRTATKSPTPFSRPPLANLAHGQNSPERKTAIPVSRSKTPVNNGRKTPLAQNTLKTPTSGGGTVRRMPAYMVQQSTQNCVNNVMKAAPPKMKALEAKENIIPPRPAPRSVFSEISSNRSSPMISPVGPPKQVDSYMDYKPYSNSSIFEENNRVTSQTSTSSSNVTGVSSENWETFGEDSEEESGLPAHYYDKLKAIKEKRSFDHYGSGNKKPRGIVASSMREVRDDEDWFDEAF